MPFVRPFKEAGYETDLRTLIDRMGNVSLLSTELTLSLCCCSDSRSDLRLASNPEFCSSDIDIRSRFRRHPGQYSNFLVDYIMSNCSVYNLSTALRCL